MIVAVQDDDFILKFKPEAKMYYNKEQRAELLSALRIVDEVVFYDEVDKFIKTLDFDIFVTGEDQTHSGFVAAKKWCKENGKEVQILTRTKGISSTDYKAQRNL